MQLTVGLKYEDKMQNKYAALTVKPTPRAGIVKPSFCNTSSQVIFCLSASGSWVSHFSREAKTESFIPNNTLIALSVVQEPQPRLAHLYRHFISHAGVFPNQGFMRQMLLEPGVLHLKTETEETTRLKQVFFTR